MLRDRLHAGDVYMSGNVCAELSGCFVQMLNVPHADNGDGNHADGHYEFFQARPSLKIETW